jgi:hypothetical protein
MSALWPKGTKTIEEVPFELVMALEHANMVCSWQESLAPEETPPQWMWPFDQELEAWFDRVDEQRKQRYGGSGSSSSESEGMMRNELAKGRGRD